MVVDAWCSVQDVKGQEMDDQSSGPQPNETNRAGALVRRRGSEMFWPVCWRRGHTQGGQAEGKVWCADQSMCTTFPPGRSGNLTLSNRSMRRNGGRGK